MLGSKVPERLRRGHSLLISRFEKEANSVLVSRRQIGTRPHDEINTLASIPDMAIESGAINRWLSGYVPNQKEVALYS
jgi:hypothetical protein